MEEAMEVTEVAMKVNKEQIAVKRKRSMTQVLQKEWEEQKVGGGIKSQTLSHNGRIFAPDYERVSHHVKFYYSGKPMQLSKKAEVVAGFYGRMLDPEYTSKSTIKQEFL
ncbi:DNA topoisomerase I [Caerostris extrusa]|uniref:DNA topoisomerase I n=1 Tax=Caerostris extrusa TaxID=172846 RepID=A0AAV4NE47_CAEEX|nr:DNA topoisomerase I [Caerostris extrusa]